MITEKHVDYLIGAVREALIDRFAGLDVNAANIEVATNVLEADKQKLDGSIGVIMVRMPITTGMLNEVR